MRRDRWLHPSLPLLPHRRRAAGPPGRQHAVGCDLLTLPDSLAERLIGPCAAAGGTMAAIVRTSLAAREARPPGCRNGGFRPCPEPSRGPVSGFAAGRLAMVPNFAP
ncbi:hypothetical protein CC117_05150 [Parafrankia colletiae]|uniref:Uncharacterized protein n=1 Tax=Parafrankia colletiae TaxID=573497 RepID=A0A1S1QJJ9_9ACTN|nr:hypothetical protein CC117_05150 [Parafrankia colletiae]